MQPLKELSTPDFAGDLDLITQAASKAGRIAMGFFKCDPDVWYKGENRSPVSAADLAVDRYLRETLLAARPDYGWLSEETEDVGDRLVKPTVFVVDPIDGTRAFVGGRDTWCISVGIVHGGQPVAGVLVAPALEETYTAVAGAGSYLNGVRLAMAHEEHAGSDIRPGIRIVAPQVVETRLPKSWQAGVIRPSRIPSLAYRIGMIAAGRLDATFVKPNAHDWDIVAADVILREAGGTMIDQSGHALVYDRAETTHGMLLAATPALARPLASVLADFAGH